MAAPSTQSPPLGLPSDATAFLQDTLHPSYTQVAPTPANPYADYEAGQNIAAQLQAAQLAGYHAQQAQQSIAASQAASQLAAAKSPYELALLQARAQSLPLDQKYDTALRQAKMDDLSADAAKKRAQADRYNAPFTPPVFQRSTTVTPDGVSAPSLPYTNNFQLDTSLPSTGFDLDSTSGNNDNGPSPLLSSASDPTGGFSTTLPEDSPDLPGSGDLVAISGAEDPATATVYRNGQSSQNQFVAKVTGYHPVSPDSPDYQMEGGNQDAQGNPIHTLDAFRRGDVPDVTVAVDRSSSLFGKTGYSPDLQAPVRFTDTGSAFKGKGDTRVDVARDTAAGANSDENNGNLSFVLNDGGSSGDGGPVASGADMALPGITVPKTEEEANQLRADGDAYLAQLANVAGGQSTRGQAYAKQFEARLNSAISQFNQNRRAGGRTQTLPTVGNPLESLPDVDGYQRDDIRSTGGKLSARYVSNAQAAGEQQRQVASDISTYVGPGTTVDDFLGAVQVPGGQWKVTHNHVDTSNGLVTPVETLISDRVHRTLLPSVDRAFPDLQPVPAAPSRTLPSVDPVHFVLGSRVTAPGASDSLPAVTTPSVSTQSLLAQAANQLPDTDDPVEQRGRVASLALQSGNAVRLPGEQAVALGNQEVQSIRQSKEAAMGRQIAAAQSDLARQRATTENVQTGLDPYSGGAPYTLQAQGQAGDQLRQARAKLLAAQNPDNYVLGSDGTYVYQDPYRVNSAIDGTTSSVGGVTTTRRMTR